MRRRDAIAAAIGTVVATVLAGSVAWAAIPGDGGVYTACMLKNVGTVRLIDKSLPPGNLMSHCKPALEVEITWSQRGPQGSQGMPGQAGQNGSDGDDGESPTVQQLAVGDTNCPAGGAAITDAAGSTAYVCGGQDGDDGNDGEPFAGTFTSPNGEYSINVTDTGVTISHGPGVAIRLAGDDIFVRGLNVELRADLKATVKGAIAEVDAATTATFRSSNVATVQGTLVQIKGGGACLPAARFNDPVVAAGGAGTIVGGAPTVCIG
jgi:hypothetical protein